MMPACTQRDNTCRNICIVLLTLLVSNVADDSFLGGTITYNLEEKAGKKTAHIELTTGWVYGKGRCGPTCDEHSLNANITNSGALFASFSKIVYNRSTHRNEKNPINDSVKQTAREQVISLNPVHRWEQDRMTFDIELGNEQDLTLEIMGNNWMPDIKGGAVAWKLQAKFPTRVREDTRQMNRCPVVHIKPIYRVKLNTESMIKLTINDADDDIIKCEKSTEVLAGKVFAKSGPHITVDQETCSVMVNASTSNGFKDKDMIPVTLKLMDYNRHLTKLGNSQIKPNQYSLGFSSVQFVVQVSEKLETPYFVRPTVEQNHVYILYIGATWKAVVYAASATDSTITKISAYGFKNENLNVSGLSNNRRENVKSADIQWKPNTNDIGGHVVCVKAVDDQGEESEDHRCFKVYVKEETYNYSEADNKKPHFVNMPSSAQLVNCKIGVTCLLPIYVKSSTVVDNVVIKSSFVDGASIGPVNTNLDSRRGVYVLTLAFQHPTFGKNEICMVAEDVVGISSDEVCINAFIEPPDPCLSAPCQNAGKCQTNKIEGTFVCQCLSGFSGKLCENKIDLCHPDPCMNGKCYDNHVKVRCYCPRSGYTGKYCEINIDDCKEDSCHMNGICKDGVKTFECDCFDRFTGDNCTQDICPKIPAGLSCPEDGCFPDPCSGHGVCSAGGICTCLMGYTTDINCSMSIGSLNVSGIEFVQPSPKNRSQIICMTQPNVDCTVSLYLAYESSGVPAVTAIATTDQLKKSITVEQPKLTDVVEGIDNIYSVQIAIPTDLAETDQQFACFMANIGTSTSTVCYEFKFTTESSHNTATRNTQFVTPTPGEGTTVKCYESERCMMLLFTSQVNQSCEDVITSTAGVKVIQTKLMTTSCVTEVMYSYPSAGSRQLYFQSSKEDYQLRKFDLEVLQPDSDPCASLPCQNGGHCFPESGGSYHCICTKSYVGNYCEKGPCPTNSCMNNAYCQINNGTEVCICQTGFHGAKCESSLPGKEMAFTGLAQPRTFTCVVYQPCSFPLLASSSSVSPGYVSYVLQLNHIKVTKLEDNGNFLVSVQLISKKEGMYDVCLQTLDANHLNKDEICVKVNSVTDMSSLYGQKNLPHFIEPSLPTNAKVDCVEGQPCHVLYSITHGDSNFNDKLTALSTKDLGFDTYYIHSDCQSSVDVSMGGNCTIDVSIVTEHKDVDVSRRFCAMASTVSSGMNGEERCFNLTVVGSSAVVPVGCQVLECNNGGFCDGHEPNNPMCYCRRGFSGITCDQAVSPHATFGGRVQTPFYVGQLGIPAEIQCLVKRRCVIPFQIVATKKQIQAPDIFLGYVDPGITVEQPSVNADSKSNGVFFGSTTGVPLATGVFKVCLQSLSESKSLIEMCMDVSSVDSVEEELDLTRPHFIEPTVPTDTLLLCEVSKACHIDIHFTNGDAFEFPGECPRFTETSPEHFDGLHVFKSEYSSSGCTSDVSYISSSLNVTHTLCIQLSFPGKKGENRCFRIQVVSDLSQNVSHPCTGMSCDNGGKCIADFSTVPTEANCLCPFGFDGEHCEQVLLAKGRIVGTEALETKLDKGQRFDDLNSAVPNITRCYETEPCCLTVLYYGDCKKPPILGPYNASLDVKELVANTPDITLPNRHVAEICVEGKVGEYRLCLQTTTDGTKEGITTDELCLGIEIVSGGDHQNQALPHFINSLSNGSKVLCTPGSNCHLSMLTDKSTDTSCQQVRECDGGVPRSYVFPTLEVDDKCITDIAVKTGALHHTDEMCLTAGLDGEKRVIILEPTCPLEFGHCEHLHCLNVGRCLTVEPTEALCMCDRLFTGASCDKVTVIKTPVTEEELENARNVTIAGDGTCHCFVKEKEDTSPTPMAFVQSAGIGAGGMASAMGIGGVIFGIIKKIRKPAQSVNKVTPKPKVHTKTVASKSKASSVKPDKTLKK